MTTPAIAEEFQIFLLNYLYKNEKLSETQDLSNRKTNLMGIIPPDNSG